MVNYSKEYNELLANGIIIFDEILLLYTPDVKDVKDWADISLSDTRNQYRSFTERLANPPKITAGETVTLASSIRHYIDAHWADYIEFPFKNPGKRKQIEILHEKLKIIANKFGDMYNVLREIKM